MPKMKTKSNLKKRLRVTASGKLKRSGSKMRHILGTKTTKQKRRLSKSKIVDATDMKKLKSLLPYK